MYILYILGSQAILRVDEYVYVSATIRGQAMKHSGGIGSRYDISSYFSTLQSEVAIEDC